MMNEPKMRTAMGSIGLAGAALALAAGPGCSRIPLLSEPTPQVMLAPEDFAPAVPAERSSAPARAVEVDSAPGPTRAPVLSVTEGPPVLSEGPVSAVEQPVILESKVGDVNGRPIFASEFLEPMGARLAAEAERLPRQQWVIWANIQIERGLEAIITDELLRAEALGRLSAEQKQGLRAFLQGMRKDLASGAAGSRALAARRLAAEQGMTEEEFIRSEEQKALIRTTLIRDIDNRVNVSWRDIEQRYQRDLRVYQPLPTAVFRLIRVPADNQEARELIERRLAEGASFEELVVESGSNYKPDEGGVEAVPFEGSYEEATFFGGQVLNDAARSLLPGETEGPIEMGSYVGWLKLEEISRESTSLYDAQLLIYEQVQSERRSAELKRFMSRLESRASFTALDEMRDRIFAIADRRYGVPAGRRSAP